jgi:hypothetical protein
MSLHVDDLVLEAEDIDSVNRVNETLRQLAARRQPRVAKSGLLAQSKAAWKIAVYQQAVLYRAVMLAEGACAAWNGGNILSCFLTARALVETVAVVSDFEQQLLDALRSEDLGAINALVMNRTFATRDDEMLATHPENRAVNILTIIDKLDRELPGVRGHYDIMSERCHPNSMGHHQFFSTTDQTSGDVDFSITKNLDRNFSHVFAALFLIETLPRLMDRLDRQISEVAELRHRVSPVGGR